MICCQLVRVPRADHSKIGFSVFVVKSVIEPNEPVMPLVMMLAFRVPSGSAGEALAAK